MRTLTIDLLKLKTGDTVYILSTNSSFKDTTDGTHIREPNIRLNQVTITKISQWIEAIPEVLTRNRRKFRIEVQSSEHLSGTQLLICNEKTAMFKTLEEGVSYLRESLTDTYKTAKLHCDRQAKDYAPLFNAIEIVN